MVFAFVFVGVTYLIVALSILLGCTPIYKNWQISPDPGRESPTPYASMT